MTTTRKKKEKPLEPQWVLLDDSGDEAEGKKPKPVCNFIPEVMAAVNMHTSIGVEPYVRLRLHFEDSDSNEFIAPLSTIEAEDWYQRDNRCIFHPHYSKANQFLAYTIRIGLFGSSVEDWYRLDRLGVHKIGDEIIFYAGDRVITRSPDISIPNVELTPLPFRLDIDPALTATEAFDGMRGLILQSPEIGRVLVAHVISGITRAAFKDAGLTPCAVLVVIGKTGNLKSHYVPHLAQLYNRNDEIRAVTRFNSTKRSIEDMLYDYSECTAVVDDIHTAASSAIKRTNEEAAEEIIRRIGDDTGRGHKEGNTLVQKKFLGNAVFIGEYTVGKESSVPRALVANLTMLPNSTVLDEYQRHKPLLVSTFYSRYIEWYVRNYNEIRDEIDARLTKFRDKAVAGVHLRLRDTQFYLQTAYMLFLAFCEDSGFITTKEAQEEYIDFGVQLAGLIRAQQARIKPDVSKSEVVDYLKLIRKLYKSNTFRVADSVEQFTPDKHDGLIYYECLCLRRENLEKRIHSIFHGAKIKDVIEALLAKCALKLFTEKHTVQISGLRGQRFYAIWLDMLE